MDLDKIAILAALKLFERNDPTFRAFGAAGHRYQLNPPVRVTEVEEFEHKHQIRLPDDYRAFMTHIGDGGAGPYHGVFRFGEVDHQDTFCKWNDSPLVGDLAKRSFELSRLSTIQALAPHD